MVGRSASLLGLNVHRNFMRFMMGERWGLGTTSKYNPTTRTMDIKVVGSRPVQNNLCTLHLALSTVVGNSHKDSVQRKCFYKSYDLNFDDSNTIFCTLMIMCYHTKFGYKRFSGSENITLTEILNLCCDPDTEHWPLWHDDLPLN